MNLQFDQTFHELLVGSYQRFVGQSLLPRGLKAEESARWLYADAAFAVLAHNTAPDPIFTYGNLAAQRLDEAGDAREFMHAIEVDVNHARLADHIGFDERTPLGDPRIEKIR